MKHLTVQISIILNFLLSNNFCIAQVQDSIQSNGWHELIRYTKTIDNITYIFPSSVNMKDRTTLIDNCKNAVKKSLIIIDETSFDDSIDIEFLGSREQIKKYAGSLGNGVACPNRNIMFANFNNPPIQHEMMHMVSMLKWGFPNETSKWMNEGLSTYSENDCNGFTVEQIYCYLQRNNMLIPASELTKKFYSNPEMTAYHQAGYLVEYLMSKYGLSLLKKLWSEGIDNFEKIYGKPFDEILTDINKELDSRYAKAPSINWEEFKKGCH